MMNNVSSRYPLQDMSHRPQQRLSGLTQVKDIANGDEQYMPENNDMQPRGDNGQIMDDERMQNDNSYEYIDKDADTYKDADRVLEEYIPEKGDA